MSDLERVRAWFDSGALLPPDADAPNSVDLALALARLCGAPAGAAATTGARAVADAVGAAEHLVFVLADGLGMNLVEGLPGTAFFRARLAMELRSVFPSTTAAALTSLATGRWPGEHGVMSWWLHLPEPGLTATILPFVERWSQRPLDELGVEAAYAFPAPALLSRYARPAHAYLPEAITGSTYSRYSAAGAPTAPYRTLKGAVDAVCARVLAADGPTYSYVYVPQIDAAEHVAGPHATATSVALAAAQAQVERMAEALRGRARIVVSADHGLLETPAEARHIVAAFEDLPELRFPRTGEPRVPFFHVRDGEQARFATRFRERFGERFALLTADDADALRLFGPQPMSDTTRARVGDFIAVSDGPHVIAYGVEDVMRGYHGGLSRDEMRIPLIVA
jgi:hypothetical protein